MNFDLTPPKKKRFSANNQTNPFPVTTIPDCEFFADKQFKGYFNGLTVEIIDENSIKMIYENGCFGVGTQTKTRPIICYAEQRISCITPQQYQQKLKWKEKFGNKCTNVVMVKLLPEERSYADGTDITDSSEPNEMKEPVLIEDPFPIEEALALMFEEAFFLHYSLKCLQIVDFDDMKTYTTGELINLFCDEHSQFIERFVAYQFYRSKNWVVKSGIKFGGDFLLYDKGPEYTHASYVVLVNDNEAKNQNHLDVQSNYRVSDTTGKCLIIVKVTRPNGLNYTDRTECFKRLNEFTVTEIIPKRFQTKQLTTNQSQSQIQTQSSGS